MISDLLAAARYAPPTPSGWRTVEVDRPSSVTEDQILDALSEKHSTVLPLRRFGDGPVFAKVLG